MSETDIQKVLTQLNRLEKEITEIKTVLSILPENLRYYNIIEISKHEEKCNMKERIITIDNRIKQLEDSKTENKDNKQWHKREGFKILLTIIQTIIIAVLLIKLGLK